MTAVIASLHHQPAGTCQSRRRTTVAPARAKADAMPPMVAQSHRRVERRRPTLNDERRSILNDAAQPSPR
jgi:hypothetical protein